MKLVKIMPRVCTAILKANEESKIKYTLLCLHLYCLLRSSKCSFMVLKSSEGIYNVEHNKNEDKPLTESVYPNF